MFSDSGLSILPYEHEASAGNGVAARLPAASHPCPFLAVRPEGANDQWRKIPPRELSIDLVADERLGRVSGGLEPRYKGRFRRLSNPAGRNVSEA